MADETIISLIDVVALRRADIERRVEAAITAQLEQFDGWYDEAAVRRVSSSIGSTVSGGQTAVAGLTDAYLARLASYQLAREVTGAGVPLLMGRTLRAGVADHRVVYERVAAEYRRGVASGVGEQQALSQAVQRARAMASTDLGLAHQKQAKRFMDARRELKYFRRVIRPEASQSGTCGLCAAASDRKYWRGDLLPIHARCKCLVIPVTEALDPGSQINEETLGELYEAGGSTYAKDLKKVRVTVEDHGELGPQLRVEGQHFRDADEVAVARRRSKTPGASGVRDVSGEIAALERTYAQLQARAAAGVDVSAPLEWQRNRLAKLRRQASETQRAARGA